MNDPVFDLAVFYVLWFAIGYGFLRLWKGRQRFYDWLILLNWNWRRRW